MDSSFNPHKFHPTHYALDPNDLLLPIDREKPPVFTGKCARCEATVERERMPTKGGIICYDCDRKVRRERELKRLHDKLL